MIITLDTNNKNDVEDEEDILIITISYRPYIFLSLIVVRLVQLFLTSSQTTIIIILIYYYKVYWVGMTIFYYYFSNLLYY